MRTEKSRRRVLANACSCVRAGKVDWDRLKHCEVTRSEVLKIVASIIWSIRHVCWKIVSVIIVERVGIDAVDAPSDDFKEVLREGACIVQSVRHVC